MDVAIIGGGAAGIAAARHLTERKRSVLVIEALPRLGGRAFTRQINGLPLDMGCGWLHSAERNPLAALADTLGHPLDRRESAWSKQLGNIAFPPDEQRAAWTAFEALKDRLRETPPPSDRASDALPASDRWRPFADGLSSFMNGAELDQLSAEDFLAYEDSASEANWRLPDGYGAFIADLGANVPVSLSTHVRSVSSDKDMALETDQGVIRASAVIVAVSTAVLARNGIRFSPARDDHLEAASRLPLGVADKVFLAMNDPDAVPPESHLLGRTDRSETGSYYLRPLGRPVIECFLGGAWARDLERQGPNAATAFAIEELTHLLGGDFARGLSPLTTTRWATEPTIGGSYSHAVPGHHAARAVLSRPVSERFCFAGEACSAHDFSTAHGAWQSGIDAARHIDTYLAGAHA
ncbi:hypothetical protein AEYBE204_10210 [Asticcacaulis sp. YBE204]|nr:hypothetical protein AEYBE204_10210 [Asticcacaulis sp. YBE204]